MPSVLVDADVGDRVILQPVGPGRVAVARAVPAASDAPTSDDAERDAGGSQTPEPGSRSRCASTWRPAAPNQTMKLALWRPTSVPWSGRA